MLEQTFFDFEKEIPATPVYHYQNNTDVCAMRVLWKEGNESKCILCGNPAFMHESMTQEEWQQEE